MNQYSPLTEILPLHAMLALPGLLATLCLGSCGSACERELDDLCPRMGSTGDWCAPLGESIDADFLPEHYRHFTCGGMLVVEVEGKEGISQRYCDPETRHLTAALTVGGTCEETRYGPVPLECVSYNGPYACGQGFGQLEPCP